MHYHNLKSIHQQQVEEFMRQAGQSVPNTLSVPNAKTRELRARLILEECFETISALGVTCYLNSMLDDGVYIDNSDFELIADASVDINEVLDGCCDIAVVTTGTLSAFGVSDIEIQEAVNKSNMEKFIDGYKDEDGKWQKGPSWKAPELLEIVNNHARSYGATSDING